MRHVGSLVLSLLLAPAVWLLTGLGLARADSVLGLVTMLGAGVGYVVLLAVRLSPVGPVLAGLAYLGLAGWAAVDAASLHDALPRQLLGVDLELSRPADAVAALLAVPLLAAAVRRTRAPAERPAGRPRPSYPPPPEPPTTLLGDSPADLDPEPTQRLITSRPPGTPPPQYPPLGDRTPTAPPLLDPEATRRLTTPPRNRSAP